MRRRINNPTVGPAPVLPKARFRPVAESFFNENAARPIVRRPAGIAGQNFDFSGLTLTHFDCNWWASLFTSLGCLNGFDKVNGDKNSIPLADEYEILTQSPTFATGEDKCAILLQDGANAKFEPSDSAIWTHVTGDGWWLDFNCGMGRAHIDSEDGIADFNRAALTVDQLRALINYLHSDWLDLAWNLRIAGNCASLNGEPLPIFTKLGALEQQGGWDIERN